MPVPSKQIEDNLWPSALIVPKIGQHPKDHLCLPPFHLVNENGTDLLELKERVYLFVCDNEVWSLRNFEMKDP